MTRKGSDRGAAGERYSERRKDARDDGRATIEVVFLAVLLLIPTVYILIAVVRVQAATFAVTQAARDAGRLLDTAPSVDLGLTQAREAAAIALADQHVPSDSVTIRFIDPGGSCSEGAESPPPLSPGDSVDVCVTTVISLPGVPTVLTGSNNTVTGVYTLHVGEFREGISPSAAAGEGTP
jgi:hypothetical protein